jgi:hypothetical protein
MRAAARSPYAHFALAAVLVLAAAHAVLASPAFATRGDTLSLAITLDLTVFLPAAFWLLVVRRGAAPLGSVLVVFLLSLGAAAALLPPDRQSHASRIAVLAIPAELALGAMLALRVVRLRRGLRAARAVCPEFEDALAQAMEETLGSGRVARLLTAEILVLYFAFLGWRRRPRSGDVECAVTHHRGSGWLAVLAALAMVLVAEAIALHLVVRLWSPRAAWALTGLSIYSLVWLAGDYRALVLRPTVLAGDALLLRVGMRWRAEIPVRAIRALRTPVASDAGSSGFVRATVLGPPRFVLELAAPVPVVGPFGARRLASGVGLQLDGTGLREALAARGIPVA